jgi:putative ABC transport system ATP-binding protein
MSVTAYLRIHDLEKTFTTQAGRVNKALDHLTLELNKGGILSVIGPNGSGKTTLLNCIRNSCDYSGGIIMVNGQDIRNVTPRVVSVYQDIGEGVIGSMTALECLTLVMSENSSFLLSFPCKRYKKRLFAFLSSVGLADRFAEFEHTRVADLSGGQQQQLAIVMAMMREPELLLLDEFVANLDPKVSSEILQWTKEHIIQKGITTIMVTHNHKLAESWGDYILELNEGKNVRLTKTKAHGDLTN